MLTAQDFRGLYAIMPTPARVGAERWDATDTVDLDETARVVEQLIADGVHGLIALGTTGECATVTPEEWKAFVECVLVTVNRRLPTFIGATALGAHEVAQRLRFARDHGADGTLLGLPMWQPTTVDMAVRYYGEMAEAFPDLAIMVYANQRAFRFDFPTDFWRRVVQAAPTVTSAKFSNPAKLREALDVSGGQVNFLPHDMGVAQFARISPNTTTACWATAASMGPQPSLAIIEAVLAGDDVRTALLDKEIAWANEPIEGLIANPQEFASYNIQVEKIRINAAGYCKAGPIRPPYDEIPADYAEASRECGRRWRQLCAKYGAMAGVR